MGQASLFFILQDALQLQVNECLTGSLLRRDSLISPQRKAFAAFAHRAVRTMASRSSFSKTFFASCRSRLTSPCASDFTTSTHTGAPLVPFAASDSHRKADAITSSCQPNTNQKVDLQTACCPQGLPTDVGLQAVRQLLPSTADHLTAVIQPYVKRHNAIRDAEEEEIYMNVLRSCSPQPLLKLPDEALHLVSNHLPPTSAAQLQKTCKHMYTLLHEDRIWRDKLSRLHPYWVSAGIQPGAALQHGQTWKQLLLSASQLRNHQGSYGNPDATVSETQSTTLDTWLPGNVVQTDFQLSWAEHQAASAVLHHPEQMQHVTHRISSLLDLLHFQWFERHQLARGAACLAQVMLLLLCMQDHVIAQDPFAPFVLLDLLSSDDLQQQLHHTSTDLAVAAAAAGAYLVELLEMRVSQHTIMTITDADSFYTATFRMARGQAVTIPTASPGLDWFGNQYSWDDLRGALTVVAGPHIPPAHLIPLGYEDPLHPATWRLLNPQALSLLEALNAPAAAHLDVTKSALFQRAASTPEDAWRQSPYKACQAHHTYAGAALLARMTPCWNWWEVACAHARMWLAAKQPLRAAHVAKMCLTQLPDATGSGWAHVFVAEAYFQDWKQTGTFDAFARAFAWHRVSTLKGRASIASSTQKPMAQLFLKSWFNLTQLLQEDRFITRVLPSLTARERQLVIVGVCSAALNKARCPEFQTPELKTLHFYGHHIPPVAHLIASARLTYITEAAASIATEDTAPFATLLHTTMQSLHKSVSA